MNQSPIAADFQFTMVTMHRPIRRCSALLIGIAVSTLARATPAAAANDQDAAAAPAPVLHLVEQAKEALARGNPAGAADLFERAASHGEYAEAEIGEVRARLFAGQLRHAVTISNTVAGEHPESAEAQALLAYIEDRTGYTSQALERLHREQQAHAEAPVLIAAEAEILIDRRAVPKTIELLERWSAAHGKHPDLCRLRARAALMQGDLAGYARWRAAAEYTPIPLAESSENAHALDRKSRWPAPPATPFPMTADVVLTAGNGLVIDGGRRIVTLSRLVSSQSVLVWVRNMRGELRRAHFERLDSRSSDLATLRLDVPYPADQSLRSEAIAAPESKGLCFTLGFPAARSLDAMLPAVTPCVIIDVHAGQNGELRINVPLGAVDGGSPVFDVEGRLVGFASTPGVPSSRSESGQPSRAPGSLVARTAAVTRQTTAAAGSPALAPMPELYERLGPAVVQILAVAGADSAARTKRIQRRPRRWNETPATEAGRGADGRASEARRGRRSGSKDGAELDQGSFVMRGLRSAALVGS